MKLIDVADISVGYPFKSKDFNEEGKGIRLVRGKNVTKRALRWESDTRWWEQIDSSLDSYLLKAGDIVLGMDGSLVGKNFARIREEDLPLYLVQRVACIRAKEPEIQEFLWQSIASERFSAYIDSIKTGTSIPHISGKQIGEYDLPDLSVDTMEKIGSILESIEGKVNINNKINRNLSEQVAALYKAWFIDFERNDGVCPEEWKEATLGDIAEIGSGKRPPMKQTDKTDDVCIPLVGAASIMGYTNSVLYDSKILVTGRVGTHGVVQRFNNECWPSDNTLVITTDKYEFVNQILLGIDYKSMNRGSTQPLITQGDLKKTEIILPTDAILDEFEALAGGLMNQYEKNILENAKLSELRDTLLPKLMSGELDVSDMDF